MIKIDPEVAKKYPRLKEAVDYSLVGGSEFELSFENCLKIIDAGPNQVIWEFNVKENHTNRQGNIHGGLIATLIDTCSSFVLRVNTGAQWEGLGVSTDISVSYMRSAQIGSTLKIVSEAHRVGNNLASLYTKVYDQNNKLCFSGSHTKFNSSPKL